ncbi:hypothetical protein BaRGS_00009415 [Batillaria attramentaria]|uniref:Uncharacterized protein n=1 Tax=Batillaria attramentaria TaxID=370345 RepID=A0ABD0LJ67_9CAEN
MIHWTGEAIILTDPLCKGIHCTGRSTQWTGESIIQENPFYKGIHCSTRKSIIRGNPGYREIHYTAESVIQRNPFQRGVHCTRVHFLERSSVRGHRLVAGVTKGEHYSVLSLSLLQFPVFKGRHFVDLRGHNEGFSNDCRLPPCLVNAVGWFYVADIF